MTLNRRHALGLGAASLIALSATLTQAQDNASANMDAHTYQAGDGAVRIHPVEHASFVMETPAGVIYVDPVGDTDLYADLPEPDLILITHEHPDHYAPETLQALSGDAEIYANTAVHDMLEGTLAQAANAIAPGESAAWNGLSIMAVPAYNTSEERLDYHPQERGDVGYVLDFDDLRVYVAGDTEATEEFRGVENVDVAFVPMNLPYTMDAPQAADGVLEMAPANVYPYHFSGETATVDEFEQLVAEGDAAITVVRADWYPGGESE